MQTGTDLLRQGEELSVAIKVDSLASGVKHGMAVMTFAEVYFQRFLQFFVKFPIKIIRKLIDCVSAVHHGHPRFKTLLNSSRSRSRPRNSLAFTAPILRFSNCAVSSVERPSTSRR